MHQNDSIPYGYCKCGCGQKTAIATRTDVRKGWVKGEPLNYLYHHFNPRNPQHGTRNEYQRHGCRCDACREAECIYNQQRREQNPKVRELEAIRAQRHKNLYPEKHAAASRAWRKRNPEKVLLNQRIRSERFRLKQYTLTREQHASLLAQQDSVCAICQSPDNRALSVDHEHSTGLVRGLLCRRCNLGLGCFGDNPTVLAVAIEYLHKTSIAPTE